MSLASWAVVVVGGKLVTCRYGQVGRHRDTGYQVTAITGFGTVNRPQKIVARRINRTRNPIRVGGGCGVLVWIELPRVTSQGLQVFLRLRYLHHAERDP